MPAHAAAGTGKQKQKTPHSRLHRRPGRTLLEGDREESIAAVNRILASDFPGPRGALALLAASRLLERGWSRFSELFRRVVAGGYFCFPAMAGMIHGSTPCARSQGAHKTPRSGRIPPSRSRGRIQATRRPKGAWHLQCGESLKSGRREIDNGPNTSSLASRRDRLRTVSPSQYSAAECSWPSGLAVCYLETHATSNSHCACRIVEHRHPGPAAVVDRPASKVAPIRTSQQESALDRHNQNALPLSVVFSAPIRLTH